MVHYLIALIAGIGSLVWLYLVVRKEDPVVQWDAAYRRGDYESALRLAERFRTRWLSRYNYCLFQGMALKGSQLSDVTTWLDAKASRMLKTTTSSKIDASFSFVLTPGSAYPGPTGPFTIKGTQTMDLEGA